MCNLKPLIVLRIIDKIRTKLIPIYNKFDIFDNRLFAYYS
jgi:hypothetical protein